MDRQDRFLLMHMEVMTRIHDQVPYNFIWWRLSLDWFWSRNRWCTGSGCRFPLFTKKSVLVYTRALFFLFFKSN